MSRPFPLLAAAGLLAASYALVILRVLPEAAVGPVRISAWLFPASVTGLIIGVYALWETRSARNSRHEVAELSAKLVRREIEIGKSSSVDELTGLYTRHAFEDLLRIEFERFRRHRRPACLLLLEIDDIAEIGEHVGSMGRSFLIAEVSGILKHELRSIDLACRYTDHTLGVLLPETDEAKVQIVASRLRTATEDHSFFDSRAEGALQVQISQGIAVFESSMTSHVDLKRTAEQALAEARAAGFGQVRVIRGAAEVEQKASA